MEMGIWRHRSKNNFRAKNIRLRLEELEMRVTPSLFAGLAQDFATGVRPIALANGDFNGDGNLNGAVADNGDVSFGLNDPGGGEHPLGQRGRHVPEPDQLSGGCGTHCERGWRPEP